METPVLSILKVHRIQGRAELTLSNNEILVMPRSLLKERPYKSGMAFDRAAFNELVSKRSFHYALEKAVSLLASRARSEKEIVSALQKNAYNEQTIARVMEKLHDAGYINDADFAEQWAASRATKGLGPRRIQMELRMKGVSSEQVEHTLHSLSDDDLLDSAIKTAQKAMRGKDLTSVSDRQKVLAALARRGFDYSLSKRAIQHLLDHEC